MILWRAEGGGRTQPNVQTLGLGILSCVITPLSVINYQSGETKNSPPSPTFFVAKLLISAHHKEQYESIADILRGFSDFFFLPPLSTLFM